MAKDNCNVEQNILINDMNDDCLLELFSYLSIDDIRQTERVCKRWRLLSQNYKKIVRLDNNNHTWMLKNVNGEIVAETTCTKYLIKCLKTYGIFIKHFHVENTTTKFISTLEIIHEYCKNLVSINIDISSSPSLFSINEFNDNFNKFLKHSKKVKSFIFKSIGSTDSEYLKYLSTTVENIHILEYWKSMNPEIFNSAFKNFTSLRNFTYITIYIDSTVIETIGKAKSLINLCINCVEHEKSTSINCLKNLVNLKTLDLKFTKQLRDSHIITITNNCKELESLNICSCENITDIGITSISKLTKLKTLHMQDVWKVTDETIENLSITLKELHIHPDYDTKHSIKNGVYIVN